MNVYSHELYHHGILNMHWGQRNGPPYPLNSSQKTSAEKRAEKSGAKSKTATESEAKPRTKSTSEMTNDELREAIQRAELIEKYNKLQPKEKRSVISKGAEFVGKQFGKATENIGGQLATYIVGTIVNKAAGKEIVNPKKGQKDK